MINMKTTNFIKENINATLLVVIIGLLGYINFSNQKKMDKLIDNTELIKENDIKQDYMIVLNKDDIADLKKEISTKPEIFKYKQNKTGRN